MKRFLAIMLAVLTMLCVVSCNTAEDDTTAETTTAAVTESNTETDTETTTADATTATTEETTTAADVGYKVKVVDQDNNPVKGAWVMICKDDVCSTPKETDAEGYAYFPEYTDTGRKAKIGWEMEGYEIDTETYVDFPEGSFELTLTIKKLA